MIDDVLPSDFPIGCGDVGSGRPLVLLHCSGADRHVWTKVMDAWSGMNSLPPLRVLRPEFFGCGKTARWPSGPSFRLDDVVDLVCRAVGDIDEPFDLVGHSFGGATALHLAWRMPQRLRSLTLIEPTYFTLLRDVGDVESGLFDEISSVARVILEGALSGTDQGRRYGFGVFVDYWNGAGKWQSVPEEAQKQMTASIDVITQDFAALFTEPTRLHDLRGLHVPTLIINGLRSPRPVQHIASLLGNALPNAERCILPDAGHMIPLSHAAKLAGLIAVRQLGSQPINGSGPAGTFRAVAGA